MMKVRFPEWHKRIGGRKAPIKALLLDQGIAAGLGNIYVDESLFLAGVHPEARPCDLDEDTLRDVLKRGKHVMRLAINHGGTTFLNFTNFYGKPGNFRRKLRVYGRGGEPCRDCGATLAKTVVGGRGTVFCPECQGLP
jgi:formamidopyrimidine-DNA glycosylase